jgi:PII-like signaling protein
MRALDGDQLLVRIFIGEADKHGSQPLHQALVELFRKEGLAGATVLRGIMGFGAHSRLHSAHLLRLSQDLPIVIEVVDTQANIDRVLPSVEQMVNEGLVTIEKVRVLRYAPGR